MCVCVAPLSLFHYRFWNNNNKKKKLYDFFDRLYQLSISKNFFFKLKNIWNIQRKANIDTGNSKMHTSHSLQFFHISSIICSASDCSDYSCRYCLILCNRRANGISVQTNIAQFILRKHFFEKYIHCGIACCRFICVSHFLFYCCWWWWIQFTNRIFDNSNTFSVCYFVDSN